MSKLWLLCNKCASKAEKLGRGLTDEEMCEDCRGRLND